MGLSVFEVSFLVLQPSCSYGCGLHGRSWVWPWPLRGTKLRVPLSGFYLLFKLGSKESLCCLGFPFRSVLNLRFWGLGEKLLSVCCLGEKVEESLVFLCVFSLGPFASQTYYSLLRFQTTRSILVNAFAVTYTVKRLNERSKDWRLALCAADRIQGLLHTRKALYHRSCISSPKERKYVK